MKEDLLKQLVEDSLLVAAFGQRTGRLPDNALCKAIQQVESQQGAGWQSPEVVRLQAALGEAIHAIHPVTLIDLRSGWNPFAGAQKRPRWLVPGRVFFVALAFLLIGVSIYYTEWQKRAEAVIGLFETGVVEAESDVYFQIVDDYFGEFENARMADLSENERGTFLEKLREAADLSGQVWNAQQEYRDVIDKFYGLPGAVLDLNPGILVNDYHDYKLLKTLPPRPIPPIENANFCFDSLPLANDDPDPGIADPGIVKVTESFDFQSVAKKLDEISVRDSIGVDFIKCLTGSIRPVSAVRYDEADLRQSIELVSLWLLPAVFAMFGAVVFQLRACLDRLRPDPRLGRAIMRIVLGAFGGIAFGWFWSPTGPEGLLPPTLPLGAYAVAFLIGYSIDIFYSLLDRIVASISASIERIGTASPPAKKAV